MEEEKYSIVVNEDEIEVCGQVSCADAINILKFATGLHYDWVGGMGCYSAFTLRKDYVRNEKKKDKEASVIKEKLDILAKREEELSKREELSSIVAKKNSALEHTIENLEKLLKNIIESFQDREDKIMEEMRKYRKAAKIVEMQDSEEVQEILKKFSNDPDPVEVKEKVEASYRKQMQERIDSMKKEMKADPKDWNEILIPYEYGHIYNGFIMNQDPMIQPQAQIIQKLEDYLKETENDPTKSAAPRPNPQGTCYYSYLD